MFGHLGRLTARFPKTICALWIAAAVSLTALAPHWDTRTQDEDVRFVPDRFTSVRAYQLLEKAFPKDVSASNLVFAVERQDEPLTDSDFRIVDQIIQDLDQIKLGKIQSYQDGFLGRQLTSSDRQCTLVQVSLSTPILALATKATVDRAGAVLAPRLAEIERAGLRVYTTGAAGVGRDLTKVCGESLEGTTLATVILVVVVLLCVYRAPLLALIPLVTIAVSVCVALKLLALATLLPGVHLVNISKVFAIVILYGAGTDYCLFLISRYREELHAGCDIPKALERSLGGVGEALAASAGTVMVGMGLMAMAEFAKVRYAGPGIALSLGVALLASLTLTPALLRLMGTVVFWPGRPPAPCAKTAGEPAADVEGPLRFPSERFGAWDWVSRKVAARPVLVWGAAVLVLLPLVIVGLRVEPTYRATGELCPETESLQGLAAIQRHFTAGEIGPVTVLLASETDWSSRAGVLQIDHLSRGFAELPNVAQVRSLTQPLGKPFLDLTPLPGSKGWMADLLNLVEPILRAMRDDMCDVARDHYVAQIQDEDAPSAGPPSADAPSAKPRFVTRLDVILKSDPFDQESIATLELIQTWLNDVLPRQSLVGPIQAECFGITANGKDLAEVTEADRRRVNVLVLLAIFAILLVLVRNLVLAGYLLVTVLASYYAALGATVLVGMLWTGQPLTSVDWRVPFFLFTILVAVGEDYNILLVCRALQERRRFGAVEGMRRALAKTGGAITSCGLIMAGTFATLMLAGLGTLMQIGFALAFGVLIDTFLVRPFLVPAFAMIFWRDGEPIPSQTRRLRTIDRGADDQVQPAVRKAA
jgi:RND superfamily putative drug exporter